MLETNRYSVINIRRYLNSDNPKLGESRLLQVLSGFSCPRNPDVENGKTRKRAAKALFCFQAMEGMHCVCCWIFG